MRRILGGILLSFVISFSAFAVPITLFIDTDTFIERAKDIVVAECTSIASQEGRVPQAVEVNILKVLKGSAEPGQFQISTIYAMKPHTTYMLYSLGGNILGTDFSAVPELSVVPLPAGFKIDELEGKERKEQVQYMFSRRLYEVEWELAPLLKEKGLLEKAVSDRQYEWYESDGPVKIGPIVEVSTQTDETNIIWLDLMDKKLAWNPSSPDKSFLYFEKIGASWTPYWEFSSCDVANIEDVAGKPLKARFYGLFTPGRRETALGWTGRQALHVRVGQVLFARTVDDPQNVLVIQIEGQKQGQEHMSARYTAIRH